MTDEETTDLLITIIHMSDEDLQKILDDARE
jgi:hypothetical protein